MRAFRITVVGLLVMLAVPVIRHAALSAASQRRDAGRGGNEAVSRAVRRMTSLSYETPFRVRISSWTRPTAKGGGGAVWIVGELEARARNDLLWKLGGRAEITLLDADGRTLLTRQVELPAGELALLVRLPADGDLPPGEYSLRVGLRTVSENGRAVGDLLPLTVASAASSLGEPVFWRQGPATGRRYVQTADPRFRRSERLRLELPTLSSAPGSGRLLDRDGRPLRVDALVSSRADEQGDLNWLVLDVPIAGLAPGDYAIEVTQNGVEQVTAFKIVP
jgi:hypothetical protein